VNTHRLISPFPAALLAVAALAWPLRSGAADSGAPDSTPSAYALTSGDVIRVAIQGPDEPPPAQQHIDTLGNITMPLIGDIHVAGLTRDQAQLAVADAYVKGRYYRHPEITISIDDYAVREVSIQGMVKSPGRFPLPIETAFSVVDLVTKAGGFTDIAKGSDVQIVRNPTGTGKPIVIHVDVQAIFKGKSTIKSNDPSLLLQPGDIVFVPEAII
jgi:polysaccharide export outer membrane protein